jgi:hypothetical protein
MYSIRARDKSKPDFLFELKLYKRPEASHYYQVDFKMLTTSSTNKYQQHTSEPLLQSKEEKEENKKNIFSEQSVVPNVMTFFDTCSRLITQLALSH